MVKKYWLLKEEPNKYSYDDLIKDKKTVWDGVGNNLALKNIRNISKGDEAFFYHTGKEKSVIGIVEVTKDPYSDPNKDDNRFVVFNVKPIKKLKRPVSLKEIKANKIFKEFELVRIPRLSVMPVTKKYWDTIIKLSNQKNDF
ncbi:MAG: hypothetical protein CMO19_03525 [Thaumarchaeota archaeon]|nr:hypothetical protein [Nitrososphaerota archaeon]|tara:strand:+ start:277 stop:702 length:426 start_codon:yes stop_codon:yes gene_type:complete